MTRSHIRFKSTILISLYLIISVFLDCTEQLEEQRMTSKTVQQPRPKKLKILYGFKKGSPHFKNKSNSEIIEILKSWRIDAIFGGYDDSTFVDQLHQAGIKVFIEAGIFVGEKLWKKNQFARPINDRGSPIEKEKWYAGVNPAIEEIRQLRLNYIRKLATKYKTDGIWLDFIRWPCHWEVPHPKIEQTSLDDYTLNKFQLETAIEIPDSLVKIKARAQWLLKNHLGQWTEWKCGQITEFVKETRKIVKSVSEDILIGLFGVPWRPGDYDNAIMNIIGQDYKSLAAYVDVFSPMVYHLMCDRSVPWITEVTNWIHQETGKPVWPIIQATDEPSKLSPPEFKAAIESALGAAGSSAIIIFTLRDIDEEKLLKMKEAFEQ